jgi:hypothetical protein
MTALALSADPRDPGSTPNARKAARLFQLTSALTTHILFCPVHNIGFGELSCYSGGPFRGATTSRIDAFAQ